MGVSIYAAVLTCFFDNYIKTFFIKSQHQSMLINDNTFQLIPFRLIYKILRFVSIN